MSIGDSLLILMSNEDYLRTASIWVNFKVGDDQRLEMSRKYTVVVCYKTITRHAGTLKLSGIVKHHHATKWCIFSHGGGL